MRTIDAAFTRLARSFDAGVATRVRMVRKSDGWTVDLTDHCETNWVRGVQYAAGLDNNTITFTIELIRAVAENTINPLRASKANRDGTTAAPVLALKRLVIVDVQVLPPEGAADADNWIELVRGYVDRIDIGSAENTIKLECRDESARFIDRWQEYERNWPATIPDPLQDVLQDLLDTATYDPGPWISGYTRAVGDLRRPTADNGYLYRCTTSGSSGATEPTWSLTPGGTTNDGTAVWTNVGAMPAAAWSAGATARLGQLVRPTTRNGYMYQCTTAGTTGGAEPTWPTTYAGTVSDNGVVWTLIEEMPDVYTPVSPSWSVTRASADDYGLPPQSYWDIVRAFVDQIGWDFRFRWVDGSSRRRPTLRSLDTLDTSDPYTLNGDAGTFEASEYEIISDISFASEHVRNIVEVIYADGPETGPRQQTRLRLEDAVSIAAYGPQFCQMTLDSAGLINSATEASKLAQLALDALAQPTMSLAVRVPLMPWIEPGDGIKLAPRVEDAVFDSTSGDDDTLIAFVEGVSHRTSEGQGTTELQLRAVKRTYNGSNQTDGVVPLQVGKMMNREARARVGKTPTFKRPGDVYAVLYQDTAQTGVSFGKSGAQITLDGTHRDVSGNVVGGLFEAPVDGDYSIAFTVTLDTAPAAGTEIYLWVSSDGGGRIQSHSAIGSGLAGDPSIRFTVSGVLHMAAGDALTPVLGCDPTSTLTIVAGLTDTFMTVRLVR
jgi:hypothetical protein